MQNPDCMESGDAGADPRMLINAMKPLMCSILWAVPDQMATYVTLSAAFDADSNKTAITLTDHFVNPPPYKLTSLQE